MGVSREKNDKVDSQKIGLYAYKNREDVKLWTARAAPTQTPCNHPIKRHGPPRV